jgi:hypothetical protein
MKFRKLYADEIECRPATIKENGLSLLLYKDARVDQNILDETVGAENWQRKHEIIGNNLYCSVGIYVESRKEWVWKQDVGTESFTEKEKGQASDSFKRACFNWGIGRELYTAPFIWISDVKINNGRTNDKFHVTNIEYNEKGEIESLTIANQNNKTVFEWCRFSETASKKLTKAKVDSIKAKMEKKGVVENQIIQRYGKGLSDLTEADYRQVMNDLDKTPDKE